MLRWNDEVKNWFEQWEALTNQFTDEDDAAQDALMDFEDEVGLYRVDCTDTSIEVKEGLLTLLECTDTSTSALFHIGYSGDYLVSVPDHLLRMSVGRVVQQFKDWYANREVRP